MRYGMPKRRGIYAQDYLAMSKSGFQSYFRDVLYNDRPYYAIEAEGVN